MLSKAQINTRFPLGIPSKERQSSLSIWPENIRVDSMGNVVDRHSLQHAFLGSVVKPSAGSHDREFGFSVGPLFQFPLQSRGITPDLGLDLRVRALAAARLPPLALEACVAMPGDRPHVMKGENAGLIRR